ncbi:SGNH family lipase [Glycomyces halotolerans]
MQPAGRAAASAAMAAAILMLLPASAQADCFRANYVALGDSYTSGVGAGDYDGEECLRSESAYPRLLADRLKGRFKFPACSGADTEDLLADQIDSLNRGTRLVTVGIGGNDIGWGTAVGACMQPETFDCMPVVARSEAAITGELPARLDEVYTEIAERAPSAEVYVLGYPRLFNEEEPCESIPYITPAEQAEMNEAADLLADVIEAKADEHGFTYVDVIDVFEGHAVCDQDSWINGHTGTVDSFHPTEKGQGAYLAALAAAV